MVGAQGGDRHDAGGEQQPGQEQDQRAPADRRLFRRRRRPTSEARSLPPSIDMGGYGTAGGVRQAADDGLPLAGSTLPSGPGMLASQDPTRPAEPWEEAGAAPVATVTAPSAADEESTGLSTPVIRFCRRCGNQLDVDDRFCSVCGHQVR